MLSCKDFSYPLVVITAPSGSGKSTLAHYLINQFANLAFSVSATTRAPRIGEINGKDYSFISLEQFNKHIQQNDFLEYQMVYQDVYYGTLYQEIDKILIKQQIPLLDIDVKGAINVKLKNQNACTIFIDVPSLKDLEYRLIKRNTESAEKITMRMQKAAQERRFKDQFDFVVFNDNLENACNAVTIIVSNYMNRQKYVVR